MFFFFFWRLQGGNHVLAIDYFGWKQDVGNGASSSIVDKLAIRRVSFDISKSVLTFSWNFKFWLTWFASSWKNSTQLKHKEYFIGLKQRQNLNLEHTYWAEALISTMKYTAILKINPNKGLLT